MQRMIRVATPLDDDVSVRDLVQPARQRENIDYGTSCADGIRPRGTHLAEHRDGLRGVLLDCHCDLGVIEVVGRDQFVMNSRGCLSGGESRNLDGADTD